MKLSTQCVTYKTDTLKKISPEQQLLQQSEQQAAKLDLNWRSNFWLLGNPCNPFDHYWQVSSNFYGHNVESENRQAEKKIISIFFTILFTETKPPWILMGSCNVMWPAFTFRRKYWWVSWKSALPQLHTSGSQPTLWESLLLKHYNVKKRQHVLIW